MKKIPIWSYASSYRSISNCIRVSSVHTSGANYSILNRLGFWPSPAAKLFDTGITTMVLAPPIPPLDVAVFTARVPGAEPPVPDTTPIVPFWLADATALVVRTINVVPPVADNESADFDMREVAPAGFLLTTATPCVLLIAACTIVGVDLLLPTTPVLIGLLTTAVFTGGIIAGLLTVGDFAVSASDKLIATALLRSINWNKKSKSLALCLPTHL